MKRGSLICFACIVLAGLSSRLWSAEASAQTGAAATQAAQAVSVQPFRDGDVVAFIGDSITRGGGYHSMVELFYATRYPTRNVRFFNAGRSGDVAPGTLKRLSWDVLDRQPTAATLMLGMNDVGGNFHGESLDAAKRDEAIHQRLIKVAKNYETLLAALENANLHPTLIGPSPYDETEQTEKPADRGKDRALALWAPQVRNIAAEHHLGFVDFHEFMATTNAREQSKDPKFTLVGPDRIHPGPVGHFVMAYLLLKAQGHSAFVAKLSIDAARATATENVNCTAKNIAISNGVLTFDYLAEALPFPIPADARPALRLVPFIDELDQERLTITGLTRQKYDVCIDDQPIGQFTAAELAAGVNLADNPLTPQHQQAEIVAKANAERHRIESNDLRGIAWVRSTILEPAKVKPDDQAGVERAFAAYKAKYTDPKDFGLAMIARWPKWMQDRPKMEAAMAEAIATMHRESHPKVRRVLVRPIP